MKGKPSGSGSVRYVCTVYDSSLLSPSLQREPQKGQLMFFSRPFAAMCGAAGSCEWASGRG